MHDMDFKTISKKTYLICLICYFVIFSIFLLIGPRIPDNKQIEKCVVNIDLPSIFGISLNCDSPDFMRLGTDPSGLLELKNQRQSRPGMIFASYLISLPITPLNNIIKLIKPEAKREAPARINMELSEYFSVFISYAVINFCLILLSWILLFSLLKNHENGKSLLIILPIASLILSNPIFKEFFWSPHTQIFNILVPIFCVWISIKTWHHGLFYKSSIFWISLIVGIGITAYATFIMYLPCLLIPAFLKKKDLKSFVLRTITIMPIVITPLIIWILFVLWKTGSFYNHEIEVYNQFVWIFKQNIFHSIFMIFNNFLYIIINFLMQNYLILIICVACLFTLHKKLPQSEKQNLCIALIISIAFGLFFAVVGYYPDRLIYTMTPPFYIIIGILLNRITQGFKINIIVFSSFSLALIWSIYILAI